MALISGQSRELISHTLKINHSHITIVSLYHREIFYLFTINQRIFFIALSKLATTDCDYTSVYSCCRINVFYLPFSHFCTGVFIGNNNGIAITRKFVLLLTLR